MTDRIPTRERILSVARKLFTERGFDAVSVRDIIARAKVNLGAVTYHFGSKEALYNAALESMSVPFGDRIAELAAAPGPPLDRIEAVVRGALAHITDNPGAPIVLLRELATDRELPPPIAALMRRNLGAVSDIIAEGQRDGSIRTGNPTLLAITVMSQPFFVRAARRVVGVALGVDPDAPEQLARATDHVVESVRRSIANTPPVAS
ncbi:MAG TPA: TetR/AcrR family transcriptional regulator [Gemmatimonadaceae bacterium]|nr:TetR/AcrR family transcriptional regulator [Gemmatimonadaceae bacterium]